MGGRAVPALRPASPQLGVSSSVATGPLYRLSTHHLKQDVSRLHGQPSFGEAQGPQNLQGQHHGCHIICKGP